MRTVSLVLFLALSALAQEPQKLRDLLQHEVALTRFEAARALGALGEAARPALPELIDLLGDEEAWVRLEAGRAIVRIGITKKEVAGLVERLELVPPDLSQLLAEALAAEPAALDPLIAALDETQSKRQRREAIHALRLMGPRAAKALPSLLDLSQSRTPAIKKAAQDAVRRLAPWAGACVVPIVERLTADDPEVRWVAARLLAAAGPSAKAAIPALKKAATDPDARLAQAAKAALKSVDVASAALAADALLKPQAATVRAPEKFRVRMETSRGVIVLAIDRALAPIGVDRFYNLVKLGFFDGARFFRVMPGFVVQFGLNGSGKVNAAWREATIDDDPVKASNVKGTICFATSGPNSRTTQLFLNLGNNDRLDRAGFAPFGKVVQGEDLLKKIFAGYRDDPDQPLIQLEGNAYLAREYPKLDFIRQAVVEEK